MISEGDFPLCKCRLFLAQLLMHFLLCPPMLAAVKKSRIISDGEESDSDAASEKYEKQKKPLESDSEDEGDKADDGKKKEEKDLFGSDSESGNEQE